MNRPAVTGTTVISRSTEPVAVEVDRTVVMMSVEREKYYSLGGVGGRIWAALEEPVAFDELCRRMVAEFDVEMDQCRADVREFLVELLDEGLIELSGESPGPVRPASTG